MSIRVHPWFTFFILPPARQFKHNQREIQLEQPRQHSVFVYGTLMFPEVMGRVAGEVKPGQSAKLSGYCRYEATTRQRGNYPAIVADASAVVTGLVHDNISDSQLARLDQFEAIEHGLYTREALKIETAETQITAYVYVAGPRLISLLQQPLSIPWDPAVFRRDHLAWYLNQI